MNTSKLKLSAAVLAAASIGVFANNVYAQSAYADNETNSAILAPASSDDEGSVVDTALEVPFCSDIPDEYVGGCLAAQYSEDDAIEGKVELNPGAVASNCVVDNNGVWSCGNGQILWGNTDELPTND